MKKWGSWSLRSCYRCSPLLLLFVVFERRLPLLKAIFNLYKATRADYGVHQPAVEVMTLAGWQRFLEDCQ
eukprot:1620243-Pyramimonas_sp.AAC.1